MDDKRRETAVEVERAVSVQQYMNNSFTETSMKTVRAINATLFRKLKPFNILLLAKELHRRDVNLH